MIQVAKHSVIHAFSLPGLNSGGTIMLPAGAQILKVGCLGTAYVPRLWALIDRTARPVERVFIVVGTGIPMMEGRVGYIGTFDVEGLVHHVFEVL